MPHRFALFRPLELLVEATGLIFYPIYTALLIITKSGEQNLAKTFTRPTEGRIYGKINPRESYRVGVGVRMRMRIRRRMLMYCIRTLR